MTGNGVLRLFGGGATLIFAVMLFALGGLGGLIPSAVAQVACPAEPRWSNTTPPVNLDHVFCGEIRSNGSATGFHARPNALNPKTVASVDITQSPNANGIYAGTVTLSNPNGPDPRKFSSIFPDDCSMDQVMASILYAVENRQACPAGSPGWWRCGLNRPNQAALAKQDMTFCVGATSTSRFLIAMGMLKDGRINTAFPLR